MRCKILVAIVCAVALSLQAQDKPPAETPPAPSPEQIAKARAQLTKTVQWLDEVMVRVTNTAEGAGATVRQAEMAVAAATLAENGPGAKAALAAQKSAAALLSAMDLQLIELRKQRDALAATIPPIPTLGDRVDGAEKLPKLPDAEKALKVIEDELQKAGDQPEQLAWVRYRLAQVMRQRAELEIQLKKSHEAEQILRRAITKLGEVIGGPDATNTPDGSSLQASALRWSIYCNAIIADAYWDRDPNVAGKCFTEATKAVERLRRVHPDATLSDGRLAIDAAKNDMDRLRQRHPPK